MRIALRIGLALLALHGVVPGLWATLSPLSFYRSFPSPGRAWLSLFPPYNEHLIYDFGLVTMQFAVLLGYAAVVLNRALVRTVLLASLVFTVPHCLYHQQHLIADSDVNVQLASQLIPIAFALLLLAINEHTHRSTHGSARHEVAETTPEPTDT